MTYQVKFKTSVDPTNPEGVILRFEDAGGLVQDSNPLAVTFGSRFELDASFIAAGIYLRDDCHYDPTKNALPNPEKNYEVTNDTLRKIGFNIGASHS